MNRVGVVIEVQNAQRAVRQIVQAEQAGVAAVWAISPRRGPDLVPTWAAAAALTERILLGTSILRIWTRHPVTFAFEALALAQLAPGRFRLGIGPTSREQTEHVYGATYERPLDQLSEYLRAIRGLLHDGSIDFAGDYVVARGQIAAPVDVPVFCSAARLRAFELAGRLSDGAISWIAPRTYLVQQALPAISRGAESAGRPVPPLVAHVPVAITTDRERARRLARHHLGMFATYPHFAAMLSVAGFSATGEGLSDQVLDDLLVFGDVRQVADRLGEWLAPGIGELMVHPLTDPEDLAGSLAATFEAAALVS